MQPYLIKYLDSDSAYISYRGSTWKIRRYTVGLPYDCVASQCGIIWCIKSVSAIVWAELWPYEIFSYAQLIAKGVFWAPSGTLPSQISVFCHIRLCPLLTISMIKIFNMKEVQLSARHLVILALTPASSPPAPVRDGLGWEKFMVHELTGRKTGHTTLETPPDSKPSEEAHSRDPLSRSN